MALSTEKEQLSMFSTQKEKIKSNISQCIGLSKEISSRTKTDPDFTVALTSTIDSMNFSFLEYKSYIPLEEKLSILQKIASSVNFCFIQDDFSSSQNAFSIITGGTNLVVDFAISVQPSFIAGEKGSEESVSFSSKLSFASENNEIDSRFVACVEKKLTYLLENNCFEGLNGVFSFLQMIDSASLLRKAYYSSIMAVLDHNLKFIESISLADFLSAICWNEIGCFDLIDGAFIRVFYYANLQSLYSCRLYPEQSNITSLPADSCTHQWRNQFYKIDVKWDDKADLFCTFDPPVMVDFELSQKFSICPVEMDELMKMVSFRIEKQEESIDELLYFIAELKLRLICCEIDSASQCCITENRLSYPSEQSTVEINVVNPSKVSVSVDGVNNENASQAAAKSRNLEIIKLFL